VNSLDFHDAEQSLAEQRGSEIPIRHTAVELFGCLVDNLSMSETVAVVSEFVRSGRPHQHVVVNVDKIIKASRDPELRRIINSCPLVNVDGMPLVWAARLLGKRIQHRVTGVDLFLRLMDEAASRGWRVFLLGAEEDVVSRVRRDYQARHPQIRIIGHRNGYWLPSEERAVVQQIQDSKPELLFVAMSSPRKEEFLDKYQPHLQIPFAMGVGGSFDIAAGRTKRAPVWMQDCGLEWFYRFLQEPRRLFRRYFIDGMLFVFLLAEAAWKMRRPSSRQADATR
jgi:N-acetylglucosaminyldiphosphoundecaprenol N-acetyl-beta-D-mannosaminyltransferase